MPFYVYCTEARVLPGLADAGPVVFAPGEFESRTQAIEIIEKTLALLATLERGPDETIPAWEIVEAETLELAKAQVALLGRPLSPN